jgi:hypothetical protein
MVLGLLLLPLGSKDSTQHPVLKCYALLLISGTKFYTHIKQQVKLQFCVFNQYGLSSGWEILNLMVVSKPCIHLGKVLKVQTARYVASVNMSANCERSEGLTLCACYLAAIRNAIKIAIVFILWSYKVEEMNENI